MIGGAALVLAGGAGQIGRIGRPAFFGSREGLGLCGGRDGFGKGMGRGTGSIEGMEVRARGKG